MCNGEKPEIPIRNPVLYPAELRGQPKIEYIQPPVVACGAELRRFANYDLSRTRAPPTFTLGVAQDKRPVLPIADIRSPMVVELRV